MFVAAIGACVVAFFVYGASLSYILISYSMGSNMSNYCKCDELWLIIIFGVLAFIFYAVAGAIVSFIVGVIALIISFVLAAFSIFLIPASIAILMLLSIFLIYGGYKLILYCVGRCFKAAASRISPIAQLENNGLVIGDATVVEIERPSGASPGSKTEVEEEESQPGRVDPVDLELPGSGSSADEDDMVIEVEVVGSNEDAVVEVQKAPKESLLIVLDQLAHEQRRNNGLEDKLADEERRSKRLEDELADVKEKLEKHEEDKKKTEALLKSSDCEQVVEGLGMMMTNRIVQPLLSTIRHVLEGEKEKLEGKMKERVSCRICRERPKSICLIPCGHHHLCAECWVKTEPKKCPFCRKMVLSTQKLW